MEPEDNMHIGSKIDAAMRSGRLDDESPDGGPLQAVEENLRGQLKTLLEQHDGMKAEYNHQLAALRRTLAEVQAQRNIALDQAAEFGAEIQRLRQG